MLISKVQKITKITILIITTLALSSCGKVQTSAKLNSQAISDAYNPDGTPNDAFYDNYASTNPTLSDSQAQAISNEALIKSQSDLNYYLSNSVLVNFGQAVQNKGGFEQFDTFLQGSDNDTIARYLNQFNIALTIDGNDYIPNYNCDPNVPCVATAPKSMKAQNLSAQNITECGMFFPQSDRNRMHIINGEFIYIDSMGRPVYGSKILYGRVPSTGDAQCDVKPYGLPGDVSGHMVAAVLGGYPRRANLYPQNANFNNSPWKTIENGIRRCLAASPRKITVFRVTLVYKEPATPARPSRIGAAVTLYRSGLLGFPFFPQSQVGVGFDNVAGGSLVPGRGLVDARDFVNTLIALGCNGSVY